MADAADLKSALHKEVWVRVPPSAPPPLPPLTLHRNIGNIPGVIASRASPEAIPYFTSCNCEEPPPFMSLRGALPFWKGGVAISAHFSVILRERSDRRISVVLGLCRDCHAEFTLSERFFACAQNDKERRARNDTKIREFDIKTCEVAFLSLDS